MGAVPDDLKGTTDSTFYSRKKKKKANYFRLLIQINIIIDYSILSTVEVAKCSFFLFFFSTILSIHSLFLK